MEAHHGLGQTQKFPQTNKKFLNNLFPDTIYTAHGAGEHFTWTKNSKPTPVESTSL